MVLLEIGIGDLETCKLWLPVVPDNYISTDLLLGCDVLGQAPMTWDQGRGILIWGGTPHPVRYIPKKIGKVDRIQRMPGPLREHTTQLRVKDQVSIPAFQSLFCSFSVEEIPGTTVLIHPVSPLDQDFVTTVTTDGQVYVPLYNPRKSQLGYKKGTYIGSWEKVEVVEDRVNVNVKIHNDLIPHSDHARVRGDRKEKLQSLLDSQDWSHLTGEQKETLFKVLQQYDSLFILNPNELGKIKTPPAHIEVTDPQPVRGPMYRYPEKAKDIIAKLLQEMEEKGVIEPSTAAWLSPIVLVSKPDGSKRLCLDYRGVNKKLATDIYPLPRLEELVEMASGNKFYVTLDLKEAYFQVELEENSRDITTFSDGVSLYRFKRLPFGLNCAPAIFSRQMAQVLAPLAKQGWVRNYLDDILLFGPTYEILMERLDKLLALLSEKGLKLNVTKSKFAQPEVKFLGHIVSEQGCRPDPANVEAIQNMKPPTNVKEVRRFLGMCGFYRKHVPEFAKVANPLTNLTRSKVEFNWTEQCQEAFQELKQRLVQAPILVRADVSKPFIITTDASNTHVGGVLSQIQPDGTDRAIGYFSKKLKPAEVRYSATDREALAVVLTCRQFNHYLWGTKFTIVTDHQPLISIFKRKTKSPRMNRWILELREYNFNIQYVKGKFNHVADNLSRPVLVTYPNQQNLMLGKTPEEMRNLQLAEARWADMIDYLEGGPVPRRNYPRSTLHQFVVWGGVLYYTVNKRDGSQLFALVVPREMKRQALEYAHNQVGHLGQKKTLLMAEDLFYWGNLKIDVITYVKNCIICQQFKGTTGLQQQWQELPPVSKPLERVSLDLTDMVAGTQGYRYVLTMVDHYSRFVKFYPLRAKNTEGVCEKLREFILNFGPPKTILTDNGGEFASQAFRDLCHSYNIVTALTTPYHPQGNSVTERMHRTMKSVLACLCNGYPLRWPKLLLQCQAILNTSFHTTTGTQPYFAFFSRYPPRLFNSDLPSVEGTQEEIKEAHAILKETHQKMARRYRTTANRTRKNQRVDEGALVWVKTETSQPGTSSKLGAKWKGPYRVVEVIRDGSAYILKNVFTGKEIQRAAEKVKLYCGTEEWLLDNQEIHRQEEEEEEEHEPLPPRVRRPPRRYIEEC